MTTESPVNDTTTDTTDTEPEPTLESSHVFEARIRDRLEEATQAAAAAAEAEQAAFAEVDRLRGDHKIGLIEKGQLLIAQRKLARIQGESADAAAALRATERQIAREREARHEVEKVLARQDRRDLEAVKAASQVQARAIWARIWADLDALNYLDAIPPIRSAGGAYDRAMGHLGNLYNLFIVNKR